MNDDRRTRLKDLFSRAIDLAPRERASFLEGSCPDDPSLGTEVAELIAASERGDHLFGRIVEDEAESLADTRNTDVVSDSNGSGIPLIELVEGEAPRQTSDYQQTLRDRLKAAGIVLSVITGASSLLSLRHPPPIPIWSLQFGQFLVVFAMTMILIRRGARLSSRLLRTLEYTMVASMTVYFSAIRYWLLADIARGERPGGLAAQIGLLTGIPFLLLIFIYALFIPNSWKRAAWIIVPVALAPSGVRWMVELQYPDSPQWRQPEGLPFLILTSLVALYGVHVVNSLRREVFKARQLGQYRLTEQIGRGGMGEVWKAEHRTLSRPAAIKLIRPETLGAKSPEDARTTLRRFEREAEAMANLTSVHTITVFDFGLTETGTFYYVMELLDGMDSETLVKRYGPLQPARVAYLLMQACESLEEAHQNGFIHRDIKPANIFVCRRGLRHDFVKVLDFGLVTPFGETRERKQRLTQEGALTGTPGYISPEQALNRPLDGRADIYALGCVGYWMLTGKLVFESENFIEVMASHLKATPPPPSERIGRDLPRDLEQLILACLEKDPAHRPESARNLSNRLAACRFDQPWDSDQAERWWNSRQSAPVPAVQLIDRNSQTL